MKNVYPEIGDSIENDGYNSSLFELKTTEFRSLRDNDFFRLLAENTRIIVFHFHYKPEFGFDYVSPSSTYITGYTPEEFYADPWLAKKCILPEDLHLLEESQGASSNNYEPLDLRWKCKNGTVIWTEHIVTVSRDINGEIEGCQLIVRDITERKQAENALLETEEFNASLLENSPHAIVVINADTAVKYVNPSWVKVNGWTPQEIIGKKLPYPWFPTNMEDTFSEAFRKAMTTKNGQGQVFCQKKNGEIYWIDFNWVSVMKNGELAYMIMNSIDITDQKKAEEALKDSESKYRSIFESANEIMAILDYKGTIIDVNGRVKELLGHEKEEVTGQNILALTSLSEKSAADVKANFARRKAGGPVAPYEIQMNTVSGQPLFFEVTAVPLIVNEKNTGLLAILRNVTEQKRAMQVIKESEEKFSKAFSASPNPVCLVTAKEGTFLEVNDSFLRFSGYSREEVIGHTPEELNLWKDKEAFKRTTKKLRNTDKLDNEVVESRTKSGELRTGLFSADIIDLNGKKCVILVITDITEQVKAREALQESEGKFAASFRASPDMMAIVHIKTRKYTEVNDSFAKCLGYTVEELVGKDPQDLNLWADPAEADRMTKLLEANGKIKDEEYTLRTKSGEIRTWLSSAETITIGGEPCMLAVATDITERKKIQEALRDSEERFSKAFHASPSSVSITRLEDAKYIEVNDTFLRDKGYTREEVIGHTTAEFPCWADREAGMQLLRDAIEQGQVLNREMQYNTKAGQLRTGLVSADIITIGNQPHFIVINTDITQQKMVEEQLRLLSSVTQQVSDSIVVTDPDFKITYINQAAKNMYGYELEEVKGKGLSIFDAETVPKDIITKAKANINAGKISSAIIPKRCKDGRAVVCDCRISPLYDTKGQICSFIDVQRDITKQQEVEAKLQEHKKLIDSILATMPEGVLVINGEGQILLANKALYKILHVNSKGQKINTLQEIFPVDRFSDLHKTVKCAENDRNTLEFRYQAGSMDKIIYCVVVKMDGERMLLTFTDVSREREEEEKLYLTDRLASIGEMAAGLAHELNNPLTGILTLSQLLTGANIAEEYKEDLECIHVEAKRAAGIVKNVLLFARNKSGDNGQSSANEVIKEVLRLREYEERVSNISVITNLEENLPDVPLDKGQLQQVLLNMISNAEAAIKEANRPGLLTVSTQRLNNHINITFSDNGSGIKKDVMPRIFDPFFTTKDIGKGTGLGLSICYSIIVKHGGKINVKSQVNEGTTFTIKMPVVM